MQGNNHVIENNTIDGHLQDGIRLNGSYTGPTIIDNILTNNTGYGINDVSNTYEPTTESNNLLFGNGSGACRNLTAPKCTGSVNDVLTDPFFVNDFHLSQTAAGQGSDSPALDAGTDTAVNVGLDTRTTRTDSITDQGQVDMGYHYVQGGEVCAVTTAIGTALDRAFGMTIYPDGRILLVGESDNGTDLDIALVRYNANGSLDTSFDSDGIVTTNITATNDDVGRAAVIQADGKIVVAAHTTDGADRDWAVLRYNQDGSLDTSFGTTPGSGIEVTDIGGTNDQVRALVLEDDEEIIVVGFSDVNSGTTGRDVAVARYDTSGNLDTNFDPVGMDGIVTTNVTTFADSSDWGTGVALQTDGKIVVAGRADFGGFDRAIVIRYNTDGGVDTSFSPGGSSAGMDDQDVGPGNDTGQHVAIHTDGTIAIAGETEDASAINDFLVLRYDSSGNLDPSFDGDGIAVTPIGPGQDDVRAVLVQGDGKIVVGGHSSNGTNLDQALVRYNTDGSLDTTFGTDGIVTTALGLGDDFIQVVGVHPQGGLIAAGSSDITGTRDFAWVRYNTDGSVSSACVTIWYRSIGDAADWTGTVTATKGSPTVTASGTSWQTDNRGRGDRITINSVNYTILSVDAEDQLTLTTAFTGATGSYGSTTIARKFTMLWDWFECVDSTAACEGVSSSDLTAAGDDRKEIGIAYADSIFTDGVDIQGVTTDASHNITLTADSGNRHYGIPGAGVVIDGLTTPCPNQCNIDITSDWIVVEWLEVTRTEAEGIAAVRVRDLQSNVTLNYLLIHDINGQRGIDLSGTAPITLIIRNSIIYNILGGKDGIDVGSGGGSNVTVENCTVIASSNRGITDGGDTDLTIRNTISMGTTGGVTTSTYLGAARKRKPSPATLRPLITVA